VLGERAARGAQLVGRLRIHVRVAVPDELLGELVHPVEVIGRVVEVLVLLAPVVAEPVDRIEDRVDELLLFLFRLVSSKRMWQTPRMLRHAEIEADRFGVPDVEVAVRLGRKTRADAGGIGRRAGVLVGLSGLSAPAARGVLPGGEILLDRLADEVGDVGAVGGFASLGIERIPACAGMTQTAILPASLREPGPTRP
jgi:hypothetical protein